jgi:hypothetical protein
MRMQWVERSNARFGAGDARRNGPQESHFDDMQQQADKVLEIS